MEAFFLNSSEKKKVQIDGPTYTESFSKQASFFDIKRNDFDISTIKSDPFGINEKRKKKSIVNTQPKTSLSSTAKKKILKKLWPDITYFGFVKSNANTTRLALLKINNRVYRKREKEDINDILIKKVYNDSIILSLNNEIKTIKRVNEEFKNITNN